MCLIITGQSSKVRSTLLNTKGMLGEIHSTNPDGIGVMYSTSKGLKVVKTLPKNVNDAYAFIKKLPTDDREIAIHFRWTTHGDTDMLNCHPYDVVTGYVAMMHNGILHTGNAADITKSDTWHFIKDYLQEAVHDAPNLIHTKGFLTMLADFIGDNRFVFMDGEGKMSHVNKDQGVEHDGLWFSNTYAWKPSRLIPHYQSSYKYASRYAGTYGSAYDDYDDEFGGYKTLPSNTWKSDTDPVGMTRKLSAHDPRWSEDDYDYVDFVSEEGAMLDSDDLEELLLNANVDELQACLEVIPATTINMLFMQFKAVPTTWTRAKDLAAYEAVIYHALLAEDTDGIYAELENGKHDTVAEVIAYYLNWERKHAPVKNTLPALLV